MFVETDSSLSRGTDNHLHGILSSGRNWNNLHFFREKKKKTAHDREPATGKVYVWRGMLYVYEMIVGLMQSDWQHVESNKNMFDAAVRL